MAEQTLLSAGAKGLANVSSAMTQRAVPCALPTLPGGTFPLADRLGCYLALSNSELEFLHSMHEPRRKFGRHRDIVVAGKRCDHLFILCDGLVSRYKVLPDGRRQVLNLGLPGDLIGFPSSLFQVAVNSVSSLTDIVVSPVPFGRLFSLFTHFPRVGAALFWSSGCEVAMYGEHLVNLGRRSAYERLAHLILELLVRLRAIGVAGELSYTLPLTQELMADVLGLSGPHVNRMIRCLREEGLVTIDDQLVVIHDLTSLSSLANFDASYLIPQPIPSFPWTDSQSP